MAWTDERVERLKKLWTDGLSASQIAADLGGVTRNAVIGKVHRLGLSGRVKTNSSVARPKRQPRLNTFPKANRNSPRQPRTASNVTALSTVRSKQNPVEDLTAPEPKRVKLVELTERTCKWPIGDPQEEDFCFCGHDVKEDTPYCEYHCKVAYQPVTDRRRAKQAASR